MNNITSNISSSKKNKWINMINVILTDILNIDDVDLCIVENKSLLNRLSNEDIEMIAFLISYNPKSYVMYINPDQIKDIILCHELVHLDQYHRGDLISKDGGRIYVWKGEEYDNSTKYFNRPWEEEAFNRERKLLKSYKKLK